MQGMYVRMYIFKLLGQYFLCTVFASYVVSTKLKLIMNVFAICRAKHIYTPAQRCYCIGKFFIFEDLL